MSTEARPSHPPSAYRTPGTGRATVAQELDGSRVRVRRREGDLGDARVAVPGYSPATGDQVLLTVDDEGLAWIVGVIEARPPTPLLDAAIEAAPPRVEEVRDREGRLLFEYDPSTHRAVLHVPEGDLELVVPAGALRVQARDGVAIESPEEVALRGRSVRATASPGTPAEASLRLEPGEVSIVGSVLTAAADRAEVLAKRAGLHAHQVETHAKRARHAVDVLEVRAGRIVERAKDVYREVERLSQTRAGRLKLVARTAAQLVGENTLLKARDRMKVKGERIHLA